MSRGKNINYDKIHKKLWKMTSSNGSVKIHQTEMAPEFNTNYSYFCVILKRMADQGRIKKMWVDKGNIGTYMVVNPTDWEIRKKAHEQTEKG